MKEILNAMRQQAAQMAGERAVTRIGKVTSYDPGNYSVRVSIQPEGNITGYIPLLSPWVGSGWGMFCPPSIGDMVEVQFQEADHNAAMSCMRLYNDQNRPLSVPSGEFWLVHKTGSALKFHNDGTVELHTQSDLNVTVGGNITSSATTWNHTGPVNITGDTKITGKTTSTGLITGQGGMGITGGSGATVSGNLAVTSGNVTADGISLKTHTHSGVQSGSSNTGAPQ